MYFNSFTFTFDKILHVNLYLKEWFIIFICLQFTSICIFYLNKSYKKNTNIILKVLKIVSTIISILFFIEVMFGTKNIFLRLTGFSMMLYMSTIGKKISQ